MSYYKNPLIGWYMKKKLKKIFVFFILSIAIYFLIFKNYDHYASIGCKRPNCYASKCTGKKCIASGCVGNNCKGGDCIGEKCEAGNCKGTGCKAGDCYGINCIPGECIDPNCDFSKKEKYKCQKLCTDGKAYSIPKNEYHKFTKNLPKNTILNPNYCETKKRTNIFKFKFNKSANPFDQLLNRNKIYNFDVDKINLSTAGLTKVEDMKNKDDHQVGKFYILNNDIYFRSTIPNVYRNHNCEWCTKFKNQEIASSYKPYFNYMTKEYSWVKKDFLNVPIIEIDDANLGKKTGNPEKCDEGFTHDMKIISVESVKDQMEKIYLKNINDTNKNYEIDNIIGEKLNLRCKICNKLSVQYIDIPEHPTNYDNSIKPCTVRVYFASPVKDNYNIVMNYNITGFYSYERNTEQEIDFLKNNINNIKISKEHHLWYFEDTINNTNIYICHWCGKKIKVKYNSLPRTDDGEVDECTNINDKNHYMYDLIDNNNTAYNKCLKCEKISYPYKQKNLYKYKLDRNKNIDDSENQDIII